ncbi:S41 family peptidase [Aquirufa nivalisilvae]|uniref:S41 family peptidase n=1 Tax=Aquirufa nivalisilvae TaxID=2516557 RepID=UPI001032A903|nr:S41 family peptidase [Aquirufa nivalisilvae]TBH76002.1 S41 family peptidase [Aquirufa nivalisilvae]
MPQKSPKSIKNWLIASLSGISIICILAFSSPGDRFFEIAKNLDIYASVFKELNKFYVDEVNPNQAVKTSIDALLKSFDPYTVFYPEDELEDFLTMTTGKYQGIGIILAEINDTYRISFIEENSPALKVGLGIGDQILSVNGIALSDKPEADPSKLLRGQAGTKILVKVIKNGQTTPQEISINRETVQIKNVVYSGIIQPGVGYILLEDFNASAAKELKNALQSLKQAGMKKLILDLRENPGGLLTQAVDICNLFLPKDSEVVSTRGKVEEWNKTYNALNPSMEPELPLIILINNHSASASEIVAGVMQDYDRAVLIGQKSFGKGLVQVTRDLPFRTKMKITTAKYYIPSGRCIQAIDYQHRNPDGSAVALKDSNSKTFYTKNHRKVVDGGGITPDITVDKLTTSSFTIALQKQHMIFLYACYFRSNHPNIPPAKDFSLNTTEYQAFCTWLKKQNFKFESQIEKQFHIISELAKKDKSYANMEPSLQNFRKEWASNIDRELSAYQSDISTLLEQEIVQHYYLQKGMNEWSFSKDPSIREALKLFEQNNRFQSILAGK